MVVHRLQEELRQGKQFLIFSFLKIFGQALFAVLPLVFAFFLSPEGFGSYSLAIMVVYFLTALLVGSSSQPFIVYGNEELVKSKSIRKIFSARLQFLLYATLVFGIAIVVLAQPIIKFAALTKAQFFFLILAYFGIGIRYFFESLFLALDKRVCHAVYQVLTAAVALLALLVMYLFFAITLENVFILLFVSSILGFALMAWTVDTSLLFPLEFDKKVFRKLLDYTKWVMFGGVGVYLINWGDNFVLRFFVSIEEIGVYNLGYQVFKGVALTILMLNTYFLPFVSQNIKNKEKMRQYLGKKRWKIFGLGLACLAVLYLSLPFALNIIYGEEYRGAVQVAQVLLIGSVFSLYSIFYSPLFQSLELYRQTTVAVLASAAVNIALGFAFVPFMGIMGAAVATVITYIGSSVAREVYYQKYCRKKVIG